MSLKKITLYEFCEGGGGGRVGYYPTGRERRRTEVYLAAPHLVSKSGEGKPQGGIPVAVHTGRQRIWGDIAKKVELALRWAKIDVAWR